MTSYRIGDLCSFAKGASVPRSRMLDEGDYLYLHYGDLYKGHDLYIDIEHPQKAIPFISRNEKLQMGQFANDGDIIYVLTSETVEDLGKAMLLANPNHHPVVAGTETTIMRIKRPDIVSSAWLNYFIQTKRFKKLLHQYVTGMKVFRVHPRDISRIKIDVPDKDTQKRVVAILDAIHNKIQTNRKINDYLAELCDAITSEYVKSLTERDFHYGKLSELLEVRYGKDHKKLKDGLYPVYGSGGYMRSVECFLMSGESVLIPRKGSLNNVMYVNENFWTVDTMFYTVPHCPGAAKYAYHCLKKLDLALMNSGSAVPSMTTDILNNLQLRIPSEDSLLVLDNKLMPNFESIQANRRENDFLSALRDCLLPKLMSCEIDISMIEV